MSPNWNRATVAHGTQTQAVAHPYSITSHVLSYTNKLSCVTESLVLITKHPKVY